MRLKLLILAITVLLASICGCGGGNIEVAHEEILDVDAVEVKPVSPMADFKFHTLVANIPSPLVTYDLLYETGAPYIKDFSNPLENRNRYDVESSKAMNFGIYMADFGYALLNNDNQKALKYYSVAHRLAKELGFGPVLDQVVNDRLIENVGNTDSAKVIINDTYKAIDEYLETNEQLKTSGYIITGGWLQTQHMVLNLLADTEVEVLIAHLKDEVYLQQLHIGNLISFLIEYQDDTHVATLIEDLLGVKSYYDRLTAAGDVGGEKMKALKTAITALRNKIIA